jgi:hypothetical protein
MTVATAPPTIIGCLLPNLLVHRSDLAPTYGCTRTPESGPAIQTNASVSFEMPRLSKYGDPDDVSTDLNVIENN